MFRDEVDDGSNMDSFVARVIIFIGKTNNGVVIKVALENQRDSNAPVAIKGAIVQFLINRRVWVLRVNKERFWEGVKEEGTRRVLVLFDFEEDSKRKSEGISLKSLKGVSA